MRTENEMYELILNVALHDNRIKAVYMGGSRVNPNVKTDIFQDYDIVFVVEETLSFIKQPDWIDVFGERLYMQLPEQMDKDLGKNDMTKQTYGYLMQFSDGVRIDLHIQTVTYSLKELKSDSLFHILLDKEHILPYIEVSSDKNYWIQQPSQIEFSCTCNEFWWILNNVSKGLWRNEIPYAMDMIHLYMRPMLVRMLSWHIGIQTNFSCSIGKHGKYIKDYLDDTTWDTYKNTYARCNLDEIWDAVFMMCDLFYLQAIDTAISLHLIYNKEEANNSFNFAKHIRNLDKNATEIYP